MVSILIDLDKVTSTDPSFTSICSSLNPTSDMRSSSISFTSSSLISQITQLSNVSLCICNCCSFSSYINLLSNWFIKYQWLITRFYSAFIFDRKMNSAAINELPLINVRCSRFERTQLCNILSLKYFVIKSVNMKEKKLRYSCLKLNNSKWWLKTLNLDLLCWLT